MSPTIRTVSGQEISILWPVASAVKIEDIAHGLSHICRYTGQVRDFYSVAQHSVIVSENCPKEFALWGLLHDASEAYLNDMNSPLKSVLEYYRVLEKRHMLAICKAFGLPPEEPKEVKATDKSLYLAEERDLRGRHVTIDGLEPVRSKIVPVSPGVARAMFLARFEHLTEGKAA